MEFWRKVLQACGRLTWPRREQVKDLLGESPSPWIQFSLRADTSFLPGAISKGFNSSCDGNRIKLAISCLWHQCGLSPVPPEAALDRSYRDDHLRSQLSYFHWAKFSFAGNFCREVMCWLGLMLTLKSGCSSTGLRQSTRGLCRKPCLANAWPGDFLEGNGGLQDVPFCKHQLHFEKHWRNSTQEATLKIQPTALNSFCMSSAFP